MKTKCGVAVLACAFLFLSGCGTGSQDLIVGKWEAGEQGRKLTAEFARDGTARISMMGKTFQGTYKVVGDDELEWTMGGTTTRCKMKVTSSELQLTSEGKTITYKRV